MINFVKNAVNRLVVKLFPSIDITGYSIILACCGELKTQIITNNRCVFTFSAEESNRLPNEAYGTLQVLDSEGKLHLQFLPLFKLETPYVPKNEATHELCLSIPAVVRTAASSGGGDEQLAQRVATLETEMKDKVSVYYDESTSEVGFEDGNTESDA